MNWPTPARPTRGRHRGKTPRELRQHITRLENHIADLEGSLDAAGVELSSALLDLEQARAEIKRLQQIADQPKRKVVVHLTGSQPLSAWPHAMAPIPNTSGEDTQELPIPAQPHTTS